MLYNREVDVWSGFAHDEPVQARLAGHDVNLIFAAELFITESTVKTHVQSIFQKLGVGDRTEAVTQAI